MGKLIIGIHTPKTAGTSLKEQISLLFSSEDILFDYDADPADPASRINIDPDFYRKNGGADGDVYKVIYGHFPSWKYSSVKSAFRFTFLRHPVDSVFSIYNFWRLADIDMWNSPVFKYVKQNELSISEFVRLPVIRYLYTKVYFRDVDLKNFDFIGKYDEYSSEIERLSFMTGVAFKNNIRVNVTSDIAKLSGREVLKPEHLNISELNDVKKALIDDINLYEKFAGK